jgi:hypothetical protein
MPWSMKATRRTLLAVDMFTSRAFGRDVGDAAERHDFRFPFAGVGPALDEGDVHSAGRIGEKVGLVERAPRLPRQ